MNHTEIRNQWELAAQGWSKWEPKISSMAEPATQAMLEMADVVPGARVLDLACGAGSQTMEAAGLVSPGGHVVASDISKNMLRKVRELAEKKGFENVSTVQSAAENIDFPDESFDAAICRLGMMLFPDPPKVVKRIWQVLKPDGRLALVVITMPESNPYLSKPMEILLRHAGKKNPEPGQPGLFALGAPGIVENLLNENGFRNVETRTFSLTLEFPSAKEALMLMQEAVGAYRAILKDSPEAVRAAAWAEVKETYEGFEKDNGIETPIELLVAAGSKNV